MTRLLSLLFISILSLLNLNAIAKDNPQAMIVFDASGSMWGQIEGNTKVSIAKQALNKVVTNWDSNVHLGLITYGHRKKGDCNDIQTLVPIGQLNKKEMISKVQAIKPKGKTPISQSIKKAAKALRYTEEKATVILISDGKETCDADPCSTAKSLEREGIDFVAHVIGFNVDKQTDKQLKCIADATGGEYFSAKNASSLNNAMTQIVKEVQKAAPTPKVVTVKKLKNNLNITVTEKEGGKWVDAKNWIYKVVDGEKDTDYSKYCNSRKKKACLIQLPLGKYILTTTYNEHKKQTPFELKPRELTKLAIVIGETSKAEITVTEKEGGKWVNAKNWIYKVNDGEKDTDYIKYCNSRKKKACFVQLPLGKYVLLTKYNKYEKQTPFELKSKEFSKLTVTMGQTSKVEITVSEKENGKWVDAKNWIYKVVDGEADSDYTEYCNSRKKKACLVQLPVGKYVLLTKYNKYKKKTTFELTSSDLTKLPIIMGQTAKTEVTVSEKEGGKWVDAKNWIYKVIDGEKDSDYSEYCNSRKKKACLIQLPLGQYILITKYNKVSKQTQFELKTTELTKLQVVMGQTSKVEISASEEKGGKWVNAKNWIYQIENNEQATDYFEYCNSSKKQICKKQLPLGEYVLKSKYKNFTKLTPFSATAGEINKLHVVFSQFIINAKCIDMKSPISYEVYASSGQMIFDKKAKCSDNIQLSIENGDYSIESTVGNETKEATFSIGYNNPNSITVDMLDKPIKEEESHEELIKADTQDQNKSKSVTPESKSSKQEKVSSPPSNEKITQTTITESANSVQTQSKTIQAFKAAIVVSLPLIMETLDCYQQVETLTQANKCNDLEGKAVLTAQDTIKKISGVTAKKQMTIKLTDWNEDLKTKIVKEMSKDIRKMKLSLNCLDKGIQFSLLTDCIASNDEQK